MLQKTWLLNKKKRAIATKKRKININYGTLIQKKALMAWN
jgi:hypothetical protein